MPHPLDDTGPLPFAPGESPFRIKGNVYRGFLAYVAELVPGGVEALRAAFRDRRLATFLGERFLASSWYDVFPLVSSVHVSARLSALAFDEFLRRRSRAQAERDLGGIYRLLLRFSSPENLVSRYAALQQQYFDFGLTTARLVAPRRALLERRQLPAMLFDWMRVAQETVALYAVGATGAKNVRAFTQVATPDGELHGVPTVTLACEVSWE